MAYHCVITRRVSLEVQELSIHPKCPSSPPIFSEVGVDQYLVFHQVFCRSLFVFLSFFLVAILLSVLIRFTASDYTFGISQNFSQLGNSFQVPFKLEKIYLFYSEYFYSGTKSTHNFQMIHGIGSL